MLNYIATIDPGHGGTEPGTVLKAQGKQICEKDINLAMSIEIADWLKGLGIKPFLTRYIDATLSRKKRVDIAKGFGSDVLVSIHCNGVEKGKADGYEILVGSNDSESETTERYQLAKAIDYRMGRYTSVTSVRIKARIPSIKFRHDLGILNHGFTQKIPTVLIEAGFLHNSITDWLTLTNPDMRTMLSKAIAQGVSDYLKTTT